MSQHLSTFLSRFIDHPSTGDPANINNSDACPISLPNYRFEKRTVDKSLKHLDKVLKLSQQPKLSLKSSPPCLNDIVPGLTSILKKCPVEAAITPKPSSFLNYFCENLVKKAKLFACLFKGSQSQQVFDDESQRRKTLTMLTLRFSHMLAELRALFPEGIYVDDRFKVTKADAAVFWQRWFADRILVPWEDFRIAFSSTHSIKSSLEGQALQTTIDLTNNNQISIYEFDVFVRLFYPWSTILQNWNLLAVSHPGYVAFLTYDEVKRRLEKYMDKAGSYVFRQSCTRLGQWAIGYVTDDARILQTIPQSRSLLQALIDGTNEGFYKYPDGKDISIDVSGAMNTLPMEHIEVSLEQYELYSDIGSNFETCKICAENEKDAFIEPCGHLICSHCLKGWLAKNAKTCPFCRDEIKGHHPVEIDKFNKENDEFVANPNGMNYATDSSTEDISGITAGTTRLRSDNKSSSLTEFEQGMIDAGHDIHDVQSAMKLAKMNEEFAGAILDFCKSYLNSASF